MRKVISLLWCHKEQQWSLYMSDAHLSSVLTHLLHHGHLVLPALFRLFVGQKCTFFSQEAANRGLVCCLHYIIWCEVFPFYRLLTTNYAYRFNVRWSVLMLQCFLFSVVTSDETWVTPCIHCSLKCSTRLNKTEGINKSDNKRVRNKRNSSFHYSTLSKI